MKDVVSKVKRGIAKRQEAIEKFQAKKKDFLLTKELITKEIDEARKIWKTTLEQMPNRPFS